MKRIFYLLCTLSCFLLIVSHAFSQDGKGGISGSIVDSVTRKPAAYATVSVFRATDTVLLNYRLSDDKGVFRINALPTAVGLRLVITFTGYSVYRKEFILRTGSDAFSLGTVTLNPTALSLDEVMIRAERPPVIVRKDTIEFNAASFKTLPDALVEDLLRKLPGVNVDKDGNILVNGRRVSTIYVDGKDFFGGDPKIATRNLPANTIEKVQVTNDKEVLRANPFLNEADIPQVINLKLKPGYKKGAFGKLYGGGGVSDRAEGGALLNVFRDTTQVSMLGYANNLNKAGFSFTDLRATGGFGRSSWGNANGNGLGGLNIDGVPFGGWGSGLIRSAGGGVNFNTLLTKKTSFSLNYFYGISDSDYDELRNTRQVLADTTLDTRRETDQQNTVQGHLVSSRFKYQFSPKVSIDFKPSLAFTGEDGEQFTAMRAVSTRKGLLSESGNNQQTDVRGLSLRAVTILNADFAKKGHMLTAFVFVNFEDSDNDQFNQADNRFYQPSSVTTLDQLRSTITRNHVVQSSMTYVNPWSKSLSFTAGLTSSLFRNRNDAHTYVPTAADEFTIQVPGFSQDFVRKGFRAEPSASLRWTKKKLSLTPRLGVQVLNADNYFSSLAPVRQRFLYALPSFTAGYGIVTAGYQRLFSEPSPANLQPAVNNTNPLYVRKGNPGLKPMLSNSYNLGFRKYDTQRMLTYNLNLNAGTNRDATILSRTLDADGVQTSYPVNADGTWSLGNSFSFQKDKKLENNRQISLIISNSLNFNRSLVILNQVRSPYSTLNVRPGGELRLNLNDKIELTEAYSFTHYASTYDSPAFSNQALTYHDSRSELILRPGKGTFVWESTLDYRHNSNPVPGLLKSYYKWNAAVTYIFLEGRRGQLKLAVNDILDQNIIASRAVRENYTEDMQGSTIRRYGLLTFTYNIRSFGDKVGGRNQLFKF